MEGESKSIRPPVDISIPKFKPGRRFKARFASRLSMRDEILVDGTVILSGNKKVLDIFKSCLNVLTESTIELYYLVKMDSPIPINFTINNVSIDIINKLQIDGVIDKSIDRSINYRSILILHVANLKNV